MCGVTNLLTTLAMLAGAMLPIQAAINAKLARLVGSPLWAAALSGLMLTAALAVVAQAATRGAPRFAGATDLPWWAWTGGLCGAVVLSVTTATAPRLGASTMIALIMTGQVVCSLLLHRFGLFGLDAQNITPRRYLAALMLLGGAALIRQ